MPPLSALEIARSVRSRETSPLEVVRGALARIEPLNPALNAFVCLRGDEAVEEAARLERRLARGEEAGRLAGVPIGVKDVEDVRGLPTTYGSVPFKENVAGRDSVHVERLRAAGAIVIGKTNTPEFAYAGFTKNLLFGVTRSPWDTELTPGGSSGGSAAAVVSGMVPLATGTDRGGSIRIPASYTGCFGMKPSFGRVPRGPLDMLAWSDLESPGVLCGTVADFAAYLDCVAGHHPCDPDSLPAPELSYLELLERPLPPLKVAWRPALASSRCDPDVLRQATSAAATFAELGHHVEEHHLDLVDVSAHWQAVGAFERYAELHPLLEEHRAEFGRAFLARVEAGAAVTAARYGEAQRARAVLNRQLQALFQEYDLLLTPATATVAFDARGRLPERIAGEPLSDPLEVTPFTYPFNMSGHPAASVPAGLTDAGLPTGLQVVGPRQRDDLVLRVCRAYEDARPWKHLWPQEIGPKPRSGRG